MRTPRKSNVITPLGHGLIHVRLTEALKSLYTGPLYPADLQRIELALRAFLLSENMSVLRITRMDSMDHDSVVPNIQDYRIESPFDGEALDYEFVYPETLPVKSILTEADTSFVIEKVRQLIIQDLTKVLPQSPPHNNQRYAFMRAWYEGNAVEDALVEAHLAGSESDDDELEWDDDYTDLSKNVSLNTSVRDDSHYLLECYRSRYSIYGDGPIFHVLEREAATSKLPLEMFRDLDEQFLQAARLVRQPGLAVDLPVLITLVLSRARDRGDIVNRIIELREQYREARRVLWAHVEAIWDAPFFREAIRLYEDFQRASENIFEAAFPHRRRVMGIGFNAAASYIAPSAGVNAAKEIAEMFTAQWRVNAMSFAKQLSDDLHRELGNQAEVLRRHLTRAELKDFGLA
jgi:hypothetical protein